MKKKYFAFLETVVYDCETADNNITKVYAVKSKTEEEFQFESNYYCDAFGDGVLATNAKITSNSNKLLQNIRAQKEFSLNKNLIFTLPVSKYFTGKIDVKLRNEANCKNTCCYKVYNEKTLKTFCLARLFLKMKLLLIKISTGILLCR